MFEPADKNEPRPLRNWWCSSSPTGAVPARTATRCSGRKAPTTTTERLRQSLNVQAPSDSSDVDESAHNVNHDAVAKAAQCMANITASRGAEPIIWKAVLVHMSERLGSSFPVPPQFSHGFSAMSTNRRRVVLPWFSGIRDDHETLDCEQAVTWSQLTRCQRDLIACEKSTSGWVHRLICHLSREYPKSSIQYILQSPTTAYQPSASSSDRISDVTPKTLECS